MQPRFAVARATTHPPSPASGQSSSKRTKIQRYCRPRGRAPECSRRSRRAASRATPPTADPPRRSRPVAKQLDDLQHSRVLADHVTRTRPKNWVVDAARRVDQVVHVAQSGDTELVSRCSALGTRARGRSRRWSECRSPVSTTSSARSLRRQIAVALLSSRSDRQSISSALTRLRRHHGRRIHEADGCADVLVLNALGQASDCAG